MSEVKNKETILKHCPFCGSDKIEYGEIIIHKDGNKLSPVWCGECNARVTAPKGHLCYAKERWNKRVIDLSFDDLITLEKLLKHDIFSRMKNYVEEYCRNENVCANNDIYPFHLRPMKEACELMEKMQNLVFATLKDKQNEEKK